MGMVWLAASPPSEFAFQDSRLQMAVDICHEAQQLATEGKHKEACAEFMSGISIGRSVVQKLQEENSPAEDNPELALEWLVASFLAMFRARVQVGDWDSARADAWAACNYSQYRNLEALYCMLTVCEHTDDKIGELQTLKSIVEAIKAASSKVGSPDANVAEDRNNVDKIHERIRLLEKDLLESQ
eukprot:scaffold1530_cov98-Cylindrotheca_fusiformis.AAC.5